jgi:antitoxin ParD1/3/4
MRLGGEGLAVMTVFRPGRRIIFRARQGIPFMSITLHPELEARLKARAEAEGLTIEAYIERIALDDQQAEDELEALALEGLNSGEPIEADERYWEEKRHRLTERHQNTR